MSTHPTPFALVVALVAIAASWASPASAQVRDERARRGTERRTEIVVDDDVIEASPKGPHDIVVQPPPKRRAFRSLIRMRTNFAGEMLQSAAQVGGK